MRSTMALSRRTFLKVSTAGGGALILGAYLPALVDSVDAAQRAAAGGVFEPNIWVRIGADEGVTVMLTQLEMGQGVMTAMPMLVAEELDVEWSKVRTEWVGADRRYGNPGLGGTQITAGSSSVRGYWKPRRKHGASRQAVARRRTAKSFTRRPTAVFATVRWSTKRRRSPSRRRSCSR